MTDPWQHWRDNLAGKNPIFSEGTPHAGFYRTFRRGVKLNPDDPHSLFVQPFTPIAYWWDDDELKCRIGDIDVTGQEGADIWTHVCRYPVSEDNYRNKAERDEPWADEHEKVPMGGNRAPEDNSFEGLQSAIEDLAREARLRIEGPPVRDQDEADRLANLADLLANLYKRADEARKIEKRPHDEAATQVQQKWARLLLAAETYRNIKFKLLTPWLKKLADDQKKTAEAAAAAGDQSEPLDTRRPRAGTRGRAMTLKSIKRAEITDYDACLAFFKENSDVRATVQDLANKAVRAGVTVPGAKLLEEESAV